MSSDPPQPSRSSSRPLAEGQPTPMNRINPSAALVRLNAAVEAIDDLKDESASLRREMGTVLKALHLENKTLRAEHTALSQRVSILEMAIGLNDNEGIEGGEENVEDSEASGGDTATAAEREKVEKSVTAVNSKPVKTAVNLVFKHLMGVQSLVPEKLPPHPSFPTGDAPIPVPVDAATGKPYLRFRWDKDAKYAVNATALQEVISAVLSLGPSLCPAAGLLLPSVLPAHLTERVLRKFKYLHNEWCREHEADDEDAPAGANRGAGVDGEAEDPFTEGPASGRGLGEGEGEGDGEGTIETAVRKKSAKARNRRATQNSRVAAKLVIRLHKRRAHPEYKNAKYDSAFITNAMSEEEDDDTMQAGEGKRYISRAPDYRSDTAKKLYAEIDALQDPDPDRSGRGMVPRIRGEELQDAQPPRAKTVKNRVRRWQIKPETLEKNPGWLTSSRVAENGTLWGDAEDPIDDEPKKWKEGPGRMPDVSVLKRKRREVDIADVVQQKSELEAVLGGKKMTDLIEQISGIGNL